MENNSTIIDEKNKDNKLIEFKVEIEVRSNKNNLYSINFTSEEYSFLNIQAINNINKKSLSNKFTLQTIKENKYFNEYDNLKEICNILEKIIQTEKIRLIEKEKILKIVIPLPSSEIKAIHFELKEDTLNENDEERNINKILLELKNEINELKKENSEIKQFTNNQNNEINELKKENIELKQFINNQINELKKENIEIRKFANDQVNELKQDNIELRKITNYNINDLKKENIELQKMINSQNNEINKIKNENIELQKALNYQVNELKKNNIEFQKAINYQNNQIKQLKSGNPELRKISFDSKNNVAEQKAPNKRYLDYNNCLFNNNLKLATQIYNISRFPLPHNCEVVLYFTKVDWVRIGLTFDKEIINKQSDENCPNYDIYYILENLQEFYTLTEGWKNLFKNNNKVLKNGDFLTLTLKNGILKYALNGTELGGYYKINFYNKKDIYLLVHRRTFLTECEIKSICEIIG